MFLSASRLDEHHLSAIAFLRWTHGEVYPVVTFTITLDEEFVKILLAVISRIEQDSRIAYRLLHTSAADIHRTACQMVARIRPANSPVHVRRTVAARDNDRLHVLRGLIILARLQAVERIIRISQLLQPRAQPLQILNRLVTRNITVETIHTRFGELSQRKMLGEFCLFV